MPTTPFGAVLEAALKEATQGGRLFSFAGDVHNPRFGCCISGNAVGVAKDPVGIAIVTPTQGCAHDPPAVTGTTFSVDPSNSYSPTSTINSYEITWGDGNSTGALAWPPVGPSTHQYNLGGAPEPLKYTITLTVTDLLGATGVDTVQVNVFDCTEPISLEAFAACGASGVWYTSSGGAAWSQRGLEGVRVYDLKANPFTITLESGSGSLELWAATEDGLFRTVNSGHAWQEIDFATGYIPYAVQPSTFDENEIYVLADTIAGGAISLFRSQDRGETWDSLDMSLSIPAIRSSGGGGHFDRGHKLGGFGTDAILAVAGDERGTRYRLAGTWLENYNADLNDNIATDVRLSGINVVRVTCGDGGARYRWNGVWLKFEDGVGVDQLPGAYVDTDIEHAYFFLSNTDVTQVGGALGGPWAVTPNSPWNLPGGVGSGRFLHAVAPGNRFWVATNGGRIIRGDIVAGNVVWTNEWIGARNVSAPFIQRTEGAITYLYAALDYRRLIRSNIGVPGAWVQDTFVCPEDITCVTVETVAAVTDIYVGTATGIFRRNEVTAVYERVAYLDNVERLYSFRSGGLWYIVALTSNGVYEYVLGATAVMPTEGYHYLTAMPNDGLYIYLALRLSGDPVIYRVPYDLSVITTIYEPGDGSWGGVAADPNTAGRVWLFGDFGAADKIQTSEDYGDTLSNVTDAGWGAGEVVRPLLLDIYNPADIIALLGTALEVYQSKDIGVTWVQTGDGIASGVLPFACNSGVRDFVDPLTLLIGRQVAGAQHLQASISGGLEWGESSTGITANAPINAIVITA